MSKYSIAFVDWLSGYITAIGEGHIPTPEQWKVIKERCQDEASNNLEE